MKSGRIKIHFFGLTSMVSKRVLVYCFTHRLSPGLRTRGRRVRHSQDNKGHKEVEEYHRSFRFTDETTARDRNVKRCLTTKEQFLSEYSVVILFLDLRCTFVP